VAIANPTGGPLDIEVPAGLRRLAGQQDPTVERLGFHAEDVRDIVLTHLDFDHAGGLDDFPRARVHLLEAEKQAAAAQSTPLARRRFRPQQWSSIGRWIGYRTSGARWFDFDAVTELSGLPPEVLLVPLAGHTVGHAGVAVPTDGGWLLHAGDAYFFRGEMDPRGYNCTALQAPAAAAARIEPARVAPG
jgi:glyoxylase-like metal-dependent hydrolase (beta-lactamase superfamily II)